MVDLKEWVESDPVWQSHEPVPDLAARLEARFSQRRCNVPKWEMDAWDALVKGEDRVSQTIIRWARLVYPSNAFPRSPFPSRATLLEQPEGKCLYLDYVRVNALLKQHGDYNTLAQKYVMRMRTFNGFSSQDKSDEEDSDDDALSSPPRPSKAPSAPAPSSGQRVVKDEEDESVDEYEEGGSDAETEPLSSLASSPLSSAASSPPPPPLLSLDLSSSTELVSLSPFYLASASVEPEPEVEPYLDSFSRASSPLSSVPSSPSPSSPPPLAEPDISTLTLDESAPQPIPNKRVASPSPAGPSTKRARPSSPPPPPSTSKSKRAPPAELRRSARGKPPADLPPSEADASTAMEMDQLPEPEPQPEPQLRRSPRTKGKGKDVALPPADEEMADGTAAVPEDGMQLDLKGSPRAGNGIAKEVELPPTPPESEPAGGKVRTSPRAELDAVEVGAEEGVGSSPTRRSPRFQKDVPLPPEAVPEDTAAAAQPSSAETVEQAALGSSAAPQRSPTRTSPGLNMQLELAPEKGMTASAADASTPASAPLVSTTERRSPRQAEKAALALAPAETSQRAKSAELSGDLAPTTPTKRTSPRFANNAQLPAVHHPPRSRFARKRRASNVTPAPLPSVPAPPPAPPTLHPPAPRRMVPPPAPRPPQPLRRSSTWRLYHGSSMRATVPSSDGPEEEELEPQPYAPLRRHAGPTQRVTSLAEMRGGGLSAKRLKVSPTIDVGQVLPFAGPSHAATAQSSSSAFSSLPTTSSTPGLGLSLGPPASPSTSTFAVPSTSYASAFSMPTSSHPLPSPTQLFHPAPPMHTVSAPTAMETSSSSYRHASLPPPPPAQLSPTVPFQPSSHHTRSSSGSGTPNTGFSLPSISALDLPRPPIERPQSLPPHVGATQASSPFDAASMYPQQQQQQHPSPSLLVQPDAKRASRKAVNPTLAGGDPPPPTAGPPRPPKVWAETRQELCESLPHYRAFHSGLYMKDKLPIGYLVDGYPSPRDVFAEGGRLIISHGGGKMVDVTDIEAADQQEPEAEGEPEDQESWGAGAKKQKRKKKKAPVMRQFALGADQKEEDARVSALLGAYRSKQPIILLAGSKYQQLPFKLGCRFAILGWYFISHAWVEAEFVDSAIETGRQRNYFKRVKLLFQYMESQGPPWWLGEREAQYEPSGWDARNPTHKPVPRPLVPPPATVPIPGVHRSKRIRELEEPPSAPVPALVPDSGSSSGEDEVRTPDATVNLAEEAAMEALVSMLGMPRRPPRNHGLALPADREPRSASADTEASVRAYHQLGKEAKLQSIAIAKDDAIDVEQASFAPTVVSPLVHSASSQTTARLPRKDKGVVLPLPSQTPSAVATLSRRRSGTPLGLRCLPSKPMPHASVAAPEQTLPEPAMNATITGPSSGAADVSLSPPTLDLLTFLRRSPRGHQTALPSRGIFADISIARASLSAITESAATSGSAPTATSKAIIPAVDPIAELRKAREARKDWDTTTAWKRTTCQHCGQGSVQIYAEGWACLEPECSVFFMMLSADNTLVEFPSEVSYSRDFLRRIPEHSLARDVPFNIAPPAHPSAADAAAAKRYFDRDCWRGYWCPECGRLSSREFIDRWECRHCGHCHDAGFSLISKKISDIPFTRNDAPSLELNLVRESAGIVFKRRTIAGVEVLSYTFPDGIGTVHQIVANDDIRQQADQMLLKYLGRDGDAHVPIMLFQRRAMKSHAIEGRLLVQHWTANHGAPYKYIVDAETVPFEAAQPVIRDALDLITRLAKKAVNSSSLKDIDFNELLSVLYMEQQKMDFHDDGEHGLGPVVASLSFGSDATMSFRRQEDKRKQIMVSKKHGAETKPDRRKGKRESVKRAKGEPRNSKDVLSVRIGHGDCIVMEGEGIQQHYLHAVHPQGFRIAATARYIHPEHALPNPRRVRRKETPA